jgi:DNA processing protein
MNGSLLSANEEARLGWLAAALTPGVVPTRSERMMQRLGGAERVFTAALTEFEGTGTPAQSAQFIADGSARKGAVEEAARTAEQQAIFLTPDDAAYPERLLQIYDPPTVLWVRGDAALLARPGIAVVGTRSPTVYGSGMAEMLSRELAQRGMVVMNGMARGVDTCARKGALDVNGPTVAVWGTGSM